MVYRCYTLDVHVRSQQMSNNSVQRDSASVLMRLARRDDGGLLQSAADAVVDRTLYITGGS